MAAGLNEWTETLWSVLSELPASPEVLAEQKRRWDDVRTSDSVRIVIFGAYDAGKSTLLKRLLVDAGTGAPEWLTISGRRETFEVGAVQWEGILFLDTPGLSGGNDQHERITFDAMQIADAYLWVLPPQLVTADNQVFLDFVGGRHFSGSLPVSMLAAATIAVVARMDEAGIDPEDNPNGFCELATRKTSEFQSMLRAGGVKGEVRAVHCVAADPYQLVGTDPAPKRDRYDHGRHWDGVGALADSLRSLCPERETLRAAGGARFVAGLGCVARETLKNMIADHEHNVKTCANEIEHHSLIEQRLNALKQQAAADLHQRVEEELLHASRIGSESAAKTLEESLSRVVDEWSKTSLADYRQLVTEVEFEVQERMDRPSLVGIRGLHQESTDEHASQRPDVVAKKIGKRILGFGPELRRAFDTYASSKLGGIDLKTAANRLQEIETSGKTIKDFLKTHGRKSTFASIGQADTANRLVTMGRLMNAAGPLLEQLGGMALDIADVAITAQQSRERAQRRSHLRERLRHEAAKFEKQAKANFDDACDALRKWLNDRIAIFTNEQAGLKKRIEELRDGATRLDSALHAPPD